MEKFWLYYAFVMTTQPGHEYAVRSTQYEAQTSSALLTSDTLGPSDSHSDHRTQSDVLRTSYSVQSHPILLLATSQDWGGVQTYLLDLAIEMKKKELPVIVCAGTNLSNRNNSNELGERCRKADVPFMELKKMRIGALQTKRLVNPFTSISAFFELYSLFKKTKPQAVQLNSSIMGFLGSLAAKMANVPWTVYCIGGWVFNENLPSWKKSLFIHIEKISARWKDVIVCVHPKDEQLARSLNIKPRHLLTTIPNGIDIESFEKQLLDRDSARSALSIGAVGAIHELPLRGAIPFVVGTVANAYPPKNLIWYLDVCRMVHEKNPKIKFVIIGDGPLMPELKNRHKELGQESYVLLAGRRLDAKRLYRAFDAFVLPSSKEGMSITLLEAMAANVPIVATDVGANSWMLADQSGTIVPPNDKTAMVSAMLDLINNTDHTRTMANNAFQAVRTRFSWSNTVEQTLKSLIK